MRAIAYLKPSRLMVAMLAAAAVFWLTSGSFGGYESSFAQSAPSQPSAQGTPSQSNLQTSGPEAGSRRSCSDVEEARGGMLLGRIVPCLLKTIQTSSSRMSREMIEIFRPALFAFITFILMIFGVQVLQNEGQLQARAFILLLKIGFCFAVLAMIPGDDQTGEGGLIGTAFSIMNETQSVTLSVLGPDTSDVHCPLAQFGSSNTPLVWKHMDCLLSKLYGFTVGSDSASGGSRPNMLLASSVVGLLGGFFFGGSFGVALFFVCIGVLVSMFMFVLRVLLYYVNSYMFIALYMILAPLLLPLMFLKVTNFIFEKWYTGIISAILLPVIVTGYVVIAMQIYDHVFFADDALINRLFDSEFLQRAQENPRQGCDRSVTNNPTFRALTTGQTEQQIYTNNPFVTNFGTPLLSAANSMCGGLTRTTLNLEGLQTSSGEYLSQRQAFTRLFEQCIEIFVLTLLVNMGFKTVIGLMRNFPAAGSLVGAGDATAKEQRIGHAFGAARSEFQNAIGNTRGTEFLGRIGPATTNAGQGFLRGMGLNVGSSASPSAPAAGSTATRGAAATAGAGAAGSSSAARASAPSASAPGSSSGGDDGAPDSSSSPSSSGGSGNTSARPGVTSGPGAASRSIRSMNSADKLAAANEVLQGAELTTFTELQDMVDRGLLPENRREEYERLLDRIERG